MADRLREDAPVLNADAHDFARLLASVAPGHALWQPTPVSVAGRLGDCGQITDGRFYKYFNILNVGGTAYPQVEGAPIELDPPQVLIGFGDLKSQNDIEFTTVGDSASSARKSISVDANVPWANNELSFLRLLGDCTCAEFKPEVKSRIQDYLIVNDSKIRKLLGDVPGTIVVLTRVIHSQSWLGAVARKEAAAQTRQRWFGLQASTAPQPSAQQRDASEPDPPSGKLPLEHFAASYTRGPVESSGPPYCVVVGTVQSLKRTKRVDSKGPAAWRTVLKRSAPAAESDVAVYYSTSSDPLSEMMRLCLEYWEKYGVDHVVANWDIITDFYKAHPGSQIDSMRAYRSSDNKVAVFTRLTAPPET